MFQLSQKAHSSFITMHQAKMKIFDFDMWNGSSIRLREWYGNSGEHYEKFALQFLVLLLKKSIGRFSNWWKLNLNPWTDWHTNTFKLILSRSSALFLWKSSIIEQRWTENVSRYNYNDCGSKARLSKWEFLWNLEGNFVVL